MYQAAQNILVGFGAICGASFGGIISETIGWRWCFLLQVPVSMIALAVGYRVLENCQQDMLLRYDGRGKFRMVVRTIDLTGALLLVSTLLTQILGLSLGGNELPWTSPWVLSTLAGSFVFFVIFLVVESCTSAVPVIPLRLLRGRLPVFAQITNVFSGMAAYAVGGFHFLFQTVTNQPNVHLYASNVLPSGLG
jgi:MFS family permease